MNKFVSGRMVKRRKVSRKPATRAMQPSVENLEPRLVPSGVPQPDHVVVVMEENHAYNEIIGSSSAPYINALAQQGALMTNSFAIEHPSEPNYLDIFSGSNQGVTKDGYDVPGAFSTPNLGGELLKTGRSFGAYIEGFPSYDHDHAPWDLFADIPSQFLAPFQGSWPSDYSQLPTVSFVTPNLQDDMHDGTIAQGDAWLQQNIDSYAQWAKTHNSLLIVQWDEDDGSQNNQVATIFVGQMVKPGQYGEYLNHFGVLRTIEDMYGLAYAGASATATSLTDIWTTASNPPAAPSNLTASAVSTSEIDLAWTNNASNATGFVVNRSTDGVNFSQLAVLGNVTSYKDTGLSAGTKYYYEVAASNAAGSSAFSNVANATTNAALSAPAAPSNLAATAVSSSQVNLTWTNNASNATGIAIQRSTDGVNYTAIASLGGSVSSYSDTGLTAGTKYYYRAQASNTAGSSAFSNVATATTAGVSLPAAPSNLTATVVSTTEIDLSWQSNSSNATGFRILRSKNGNHFKYLASVGGSVTTYKDTGLTPGTTYYYRVQADNAAGYSAPSNVATATTATPINLAITTAAVTGGVSVNLSGSFADPDNSASDAHQVVTNWGDGSAPTTLSLAGGVLQFNGLRHLYASSGQASQTFTLTVTGADGLDAVISKLITLTF
jgi:fibronectin type 3 domain-containing protein